MVDAMVLDTSSHLDKLETDRSALESALADGKDDDTVSLATQKLCQTTKDYKAAAAHVKRASAKPKPKQKKLTESEAKEPPHGGAAWDFEVEIDPRGGEWPSWKPILVCFMVLY